MTTQQDVALIYRARQDVDHMRDCGWFFEADALEALANRLEELTQPAPQDTVPIQTAWEWAGGNPGIKATASDLEQALKQLDKVCDDVVALGPKLLKREQPAPLALSAEDAQAWGELVESCKAPGFWKANRAILAVDKLLRQRVQRLTDVSVEVAAEANAPGWFCVRVYVGGILLSPEMLYIKDGAEHEAARLRTAFGIADHSDGNKKVGGEA